METEEISVMVEKSYHNEMREIAQEIWNKHGICLRSVRFSWADLSTPTEAKLLVMDVEAESLTKA